MNFFVNSILAKISLLILQKFLIIWIMFKNSFNFRKKYLKLQYFRLINKFKWNFLFKIFLLFSLIKIYYLNILIENI